jgi:hypothetical protein
VRIDRAVQLARALGDLAFCQVVHDMP